MTTTIRLEEHGNDQQKLVELYIKDTHSGLDDCIQLQEADLYTLQAFQQRYQNRAKQGGELKETGQAIYQWLNQRQWLDRVISAMPMAPWQVEFQLNQLPESEIQTAFFNVPWEVLADEHTFLAGKMGLNYSPLRRIGHPKNIPDPSGYRLSVMFMAASPIGSTRLDYEAEESAILDACGGIHQQQLDLYVEESGNLQQLASELKQIHNSDILHLSCHGTTGDGNTPPALVLEDRYGQKQTSNAAQLYAALRNHLPRLLVLSACHSADSISNTLSLSLLQAGIPAVIGMGGAVSDQDARRFTACLYHNLAESASLQHAIG